MMAVPLLTTDEHMSQLELFDIASPCIRVCQTDSRGFCVGCLRSRDERFNWLNYSTEEKRAVIARCAYRKKRIAYALYKKRQAEQQPNSSTVDEPDMFDELDEQLKTTVK